MRNFSVSSTNSGVRRQKIRGFAGRSCPTANQQQGLNWCTSSFKYSPKRSITMRQLEIIHCNCSLEDSTVFWPWKREVKATSSSLHSLGVLVSLPCPGAPCLSLFLAHVWMSQGKTPRNENTVVWWGLGFAGCWWEKSRRANTEGMSLWRRAEEPFGSAGFPASQLCLWQGLSLWGCGLQAVKPSTKAVESLFSGSWLELRCR